MARHAKSSSSASPKRKRKWSAAVMKRSDALDLEQGVFTKSSASRIAASLKRSAIQSQRRKGTPFQSAMSMLSFHINRAGKSLTAVQRARLERAKDELRRLFGKIGRDTHKPRKRQTKTNMTGAPRKRR